MHQIKIKNLSSKTIESEEKSEKLIDILLQHTDWMHACGKKGRCTTCKVRVLQHWINLGDYTNAEQRFVDLNKLRENERLSCQATLLGNIEIEVPDENKLPHINYDY